MCTVIFLSQFKFYNVQIENVNWFTKLNSVEEDKDESKLVINTTQSEFPVVTESPGAYFNKGIN